MQDMITQRNEPTAIYRDIAERTGGDIYIGITGPCRTGKSTFIKRFLETLVLPGIENPYDRDRARDAMPQSAAGKTVMTTEPKFIPDEAVQITIGENAGFRVKMIDCVGFIVPDALGHIENGTPRMVMTPWSPDPMPFGEAAEIGTRKVIRDHSTIGIMVTCDGSIADIARQSYVPAEEAVVAELKQMGKPFAIILNSADPDAEEAHRLAYELEAKYAAPVALVNCLALNAEDIRRILELILLEFPVTEIGCSLPSWVSALEPTHWLSSSVRESVLACAGKVRRACDIAEAFASLTENEHIIHAGVEKLDLGSGKAVIDIKLEESLYYKVLSELAGMDIDSDERLIALLRELTEVKAKYDRVAEALEAVNESGYGIVTPDIDDLRLEEPEIVKQPGGYGVKLRASAPSIHMIRAEIETEINPVVGTEQQSEELVGFLLREFEEDPKKIWSSNLFGKTLHELVTEGLHSKLSHMPDDARAKLSETLCRIINEGSNGLICIIL